MKSVSLVAWANLRRRKKENLMVGINIFLSVLLLTTAVGILGGIHKPFDTMFDKLHASHILLYYDNRENNAAAIKQWFEKQPEVSFVSDPHYYVTVSEPIMYREQKIDIMMRITEYNPEQQQKYDKLLGMAGNTQSSPGWGEVWIPRHLAIKYSISIGDTLLAPLPTGQYPLVVSAIIIDPHFVSGLINPNRIWVARGMLPFMVNTNALNQVMQGIRLHRKQDIDSLWTRFTTEGNFSGTSLQYSLFKSVFTSMYKIIGLVILIFSILAIIISCYIISSMVISGVLGDRKLTGILKATGFKTRQVTGIYMMQYGLLLLIGLPAGLTAGYVAIHTILNSLLRSIGLINFSFPYLTIFLGTSFFFVLLLFFLVWMLTRKAAKSPPARALQPVQAEPRLQYKKSRNTKNITPNSLSLWIGNKLLFDTPVKSVLSLVSMILIVFMLDFAVNISHSFNKINEHKSLWGFDNSDIQVSRAQGVILPITHEKFIENMFQDSMIKDVIPFSYYDLTIPGKQNIPTLKLNGKVFEKSPDNVGLENLVGNHPVGPDEISLCVGTAEKLHKSVGDSIKVLIEQEAKQFFVSGIYQDISNLGEGFRLPEAAVKTVNPLYTPDRYALVLRDKKQRKEVKKQLLQRYGEAISVELSIEEQLGFMGITKSINASMLLISMFFIGILFVSVFSNVFLSIWENWQTIGIYRLIGFTPSQLRNIMLWRTLILTVTGIFLGIPMVIVLGRKLISSITAGFGVVHFPFVFSIKGSVAIMAFFLFTAIISTWRASGDIKKISPRILVNE